MSQTRVKSAVREDRQRSEAAGAERGVSGRGAVTRWLALGVLAVAAAAAVVPARADWLVLEDGEQIETQGPWKVEGNRVLYTSARGTLSSIRASGVDLEASRDLTAEKAKPAEESAAVETAPAAKTPVLVLTDADFPRQTSAPPVEAGAAGEEADEAGGGDTAGTPVPPSDNLENRPARQITPGPVRVLNWSARPTGNDQIALVGYIQNTGSEVATAVAVSVSLIDSEDVLIGTADAQLSAAALMPGVQAYFEARFQDDINFSSVEFSTSSIDLEVSAEAGEEAAPEALETAPAEEPTP